MNIFEYMWGLVFLLAFMDFAANPKKALMDAYCTLITPNPRISADGRRMYFPKSPCYTRPVKNKKRAVTSPTRKVTDWHLVSQNSTGQN